MGDNDQWLLLVYTLPAEPSRGRVAVWRRLKKLGAVSALQSVWVLPNQPHFRQQFELLQTEIEGLGGEAFILSATALTQAGDKKIGSIFNDARNPEYEEIIEKCRDFLVEIENETTKKNFTFAEVEENEEELTKLTSWYVKVANRDFFQCPKRKEVEPLLAECNQRLQEFSHKVYSLNLDINFMEKEDEQDV